MILGKQESEIVSLAVQYQSAMTDGVVQYNYETDKIFGASFTTGTVENPNNPFIEVFRLRQGESGEIRYECGDCPFECGFSDDEERSLYPDSKKECCMDAYIDNDFDDDFEDNFKESLQEQIYDVLDDFLSVVLNKLDEIRIDVSDIIEPWNYLNVRQDNWKMRVIDSYVDSAIEWGFSIDCEPIGYVDAEVQYIAELLRTSQNETLQKVGSLVEDGDLDGALELLH